MDNARNRIKGLRFRGEYTKAIQLIDDYHKKNVLNEEEILLLALDKCKILLKSGKYAGALLAIEELIRMCEEKCFPTLIIDAKLMKIDALEKSDRESEALTLLDEIEDYLAAHKEISNPERKRCFSEILYYRGSIHWQLSNLDKANVFLRKSIAIKKELDDKESLAIAYNRLGTSLSYQGKLDESMNYFKMHLSINQEMNNLIEIATAFNNIGFLYSVKGEYEFAVECYENSLKLNEILNHSYFAAIWKINLATCYYPLGKHQKALKYAKESLELHQEAQSSDYFLSISLLYIIELLIAAEFENEDVYSYYDMLESLYLKNKENKTIQHRYEFAKALVLKASDRLSDKMQAQTLFKQIVEDKVVALNNSVKSLLNLAELLIIEFKSTENQKVLLELEQLTNNLLNIGKEQKNYPVQVKTLLLRSKLKLLNLEIDESESFLEEAKQICEKRGLSRLAMTIIEEQESLINKKKKLNESTDEKRSYEEKVEFTEIDNILTRMVKDNLEVNINFDKIVDSFTNDKLSLVVCKFSELGAEVVAASNLPKGSEFDKYSTFMAVSFMTILGQGREYHEGLFGPLPVPIKGYSSIVFSKIISDRNLTDPRLKGKNFTLFCILYPQEYSLLFYDRKSISKLFDTKLNEIDDLAELSDTFLDDLRTNIYNKVSELIAPKKLDIGLINY